MFKSNFRLENGAVTLTRTGFLVEDMPEVAEAHVENWKKKGDGNDDIHIANLQKKIKHHHDAVLRALKKVTKLENQLWGMQQLVERKKEEEKRRDDKAIEKAARLKREELERLKRQEAELAARKARSKPLEPMSKKRGSSDEEEEQKHETKKHIPKKKPEAEEKVAEAEEEVAKIPKPPKAYKPLNEKEWARWNSFLGFSHNEWQYSVEHGTEAMERLVCRGANHLIPEILPGQKHAWIEPPIAILIPVTAVPLAQEVAAEALPPLPPSPVSDQGLDMSSLNLD